MILIKLSFTRSLTVESRSTVGGDVQQGLRQDAVPLEALDEYIPLPLGQLSAVFVHQKRQVSEGGRLPSKSTIHEYMFGGGNEPLRASKNMADLHVVIVDDVCKMISGETVCFYHHGVALHLEETTQGRIFNIKVYAKVFPPGLENCHFQIR